MQGGSGRASARSLDVVEEVVRREREVQMRHWEAVDAKAGVMLAFAGALAALAPAGVSLLVDVGRAIAVGGALVALWAFWPRGYGAVKLRAFRDRYLSSEPTFARLHLTDSLITTVERDAAILDRKADRLKVAMALLAAAACLVTVGSVID